MTAGPWRPGVSPEGSRGPHRGPGLTGARPALRGSAPRPAFQMRQCLLATVEACLAYGEQALRHARIDCVGRGLVAHRWRIVRRHEAFANSTAAARPDRISVTKCEDCAEIPCDRAIFGGLSHVNRSCLSVCDRDRPMVARGSADVPGTAGGGYFGSRCRDWVLRCGASATIAQPARRIKKKNVASHIAHRVLSVGLEVLRAHNILWKHHISPQGCAGLAAESSQNYSFVHYRRSVGLLLTRVGPMWFSPDRSRGRSPRRNPVSWIGTQDTASSVPATPRNSALADAVVRTQGRLT